MKEENDKSKKLQTVERALDVLYLFHKYNGITLSFVAEEMNMSTTVAYRLLYTLADSGFLRQEKASKRRACCWATARYVPRSWRKQPIPL